MTSQTEITVNWETLTEWVGAAPDWVNRVFSCDCAERALRRYVQEDHEVWECLKTARDFAEGREYTGEFMNETWDRMMNTMRRATGGSRRAKLAVTWACASFRFSSIAAIEAAKAGGELDWAILHFLHLLKEYNAARSTLIAVISARADVVMRTVTQYARTLEERVFE